MDDAKHRLLAQLPDGPRWIETRDLLRDTSSSLLENRGDGGFVVWSERYGLGAVVGRAPREAVVLAASVCPEIIAFPENIQAVRDLLPGFEAEPAHILLAPTAVRTSPAHPCRELSGDDIASLSHLPRDVQQELVAAAADDARVVAAFASEVPVAFAYVASETESLWDVSIETLASHRRQGYASAAVLNLMRLMSGQAKRAVWGALHSNQASRGLALALGFVDVDELWVLSR